MFQNVRKRLWAHFRYGITFDMFLLLLRGPYQILMQSIMVRVRHGLKQDSTIVASIIRTPYPYPFLRWRSCTKGPFPFKGWDVSEEGRCKTQDGTENGILSLFPASAHPCPEILF